MSRRRTMMLQQQSKPDLLEGYRTDSAWDSYYTYTKWLTDDIVQMYHTRSGFAGPDKIAKGFINCRESSTSWGAVLGTTPMSTLELWKSYKLTLTVTEVLQNTATADNDGIFLVVLGRSGYGTTQQKNFSEITVGTKFEVTTSYANNWACINGAAIEVTNASLLWDFKFKVEFEEV